MGKRSGKKKAAAERKKKKVTISPLEREQENGQVPHAYRILDWLIRTHHDHLEDAEFKIAYQMSALKEDADGTVGFGRVKRGNDLDRAYADFDFVIILPHDLWQNSDNVRRHAIIDYHLCSCAITKDPHGEPMVDEQDRNVYRIRKPIRVFKENVGRYAFWQSDVIGDAFKRYKDRDRPLLPADREMGRGFDEPATGPLKDDPKPEKSKAKASAESNGQAGDDSAHDAGKSGGAYDVKLDELGLDAASVQALTGEGLDSLGSILDYERAHNDFKGVAGMTASRRSMLKQKLGDYLVEHPEFVPEGEGAPAA